MTWIYKFHSNWCFFKSAQVPWTYFYHFVLNSWCFQRPSASEAANLIHLHLWAPRSWMFPGKMPSKLDLSRWLLLETAGVMCHRSWIIQTSPLLSLKQCFLARSSMDGLLQAFRAVTCVVH